MTLLSIARKGYGIPSPPITNLWMVSDVVFGLRHFSLRAGVGHGCTQCIAIVCPFLSELCKENYHCIHKSTSQTCWRRWNVRRYCTTVSSRLFEDSRASIGGRCSVVSWWAARRTPYRPKTFAFTRQHLTYIQRTTNFTSLITRWDPHTWYRTPIAI